MRSDGRLNAGAASRTRVIYRGMALILYFTAVLSLAFALIATIWLGLAALGWSAPLNSTAALVVAVIVTVVLLFYAYRAGKRRDADPLIRDRS